MSLPNLLWIRADGGDVTNEARFLDDVPYVPASALDAATEALRLERAESKRLRDVIIAAANAIRNEINPSNYDDECQLDEESVEMAIIVLHAALTPRPGAKES